jgi:hypothetical protein
MDCATSLDGEKLRRHDVTLEVFRTSAGGIDERSLIGLRGPPKECLMLPESARGKPL